MDEQNIPIDINSSKLLDWLTSRRQCSSNWQNGIINIREKINNAIQDMPAHDGIVKLLSGSHINYFHCLSIIEILKETEADTKNLFGRYGSQRMKDWQEIVQLYQKENTYLAEAAQILIRNVNYEVPSLKKQIAKFDQVENECEKKINDYSKTENMMQSEFNNTCKQLGITGTHLKKELIGLLDELPELYERAAKNIKLVKPAVLLYAAFVKFVSGKEDVNVLSILQYLVENGNTTTYEWIYGEKPVSIELPVQETLEESNADTGGDGIDFGDGNAIDFGSEDNAIDFGDTLDKGDIDWGNISSVEANPDVTSDSINFDVSLEESGIVVEETGLDGGVARGSEAFTILDNPKTRDQVLNNLIELESFLRMRLYEISQEADLISMSIMQEAPSIIQMQTVESITSMMDQLNIALDGLINKRTLHLHNIKHSPKYVDILTANLNQKLSVVERMETTKKIMSDKIAEVRKQRQSIKPLIGVIVEKTKILQKQIEEDISKKYKGRKVNIIGGVNAL